VGEEAGSLREAVEGSRFFRWVLARSQSWTADVGPEAVGEVTVVAGLLPLPPEVRELAGPLPVVFGGEALVFDGTAYPSSRLGAAFRLPAGAPAAWLVTGRDPRALAGVLDQVLAVETGISIWGADAGGGIDYLLRENHWLERRGRWRKEGSGSAAGRLAVDRGRDRDDFAERERWMASLRSIEAGPVRLRVPPGWEAREDLRALAAELERTVAAVAPRVPVRPEEPLTVVVEPDFVLQGRWTGEIGVAVAGDPGGGIDLHVVFDPRDLPAVRFAVARALVRRGVPELTERPWLEAGAALWLLGDGARGEWYGRPWRRWLPTLAAAGVLPRAEDLLASEVAPDASDVLWTPAAAALVEPLAGETVAEKLGQAPGTPAVRALLARVAEAAETTGPAATAEARPAASPAVPGFLRGVSFAMRNGLTVGYHSPQASVRLEALAEMGADAVSLMPFAYQPDPHQPELRFLHRSPTSETDVGMIHAARAAKERGLTVLWKPHIWVGHGVWSGEIAMTDEAGWQRWWEVYRRFLLHHAVLARWAGADLLSLGVELGGTLERQADWERLIGAARRVFPGPLTYSANWWGDAEEVGFWERLDAVGVDAYYPLSGSAEATRDELVAGAREVRRRLAALAETHHRPVLLTEVGFASRRAAWTAPHEEGGEVSEADQAAAYEALFTGLGRPPWLAGVFVWKAFSGERGDGAEAEPPRADFRFLGRAAEAAVRGYFTPREEPRPSAR
jgi:hypothetical protein